MPKRTRLGLTLRPAMALAAVTAIAAALLASGCSKPAATPTTPVAPVAVAPATPAPGATGATSAVAPTSTAPVATTPRPVVMATSRVYLVRGEFLGVGAARRVPATSPARGAMLQLLAGPTVAERSWGLASEIPKGTKLLGVKIAGGIATVDLSKRFESGGGTFTMTLRIAQVVNTLTQFPGVNKVAFLIGGKRVASIGGEGIMVSPPVGRADYADELPAIMLELPLPGATIKSPVRLKGSANVFEGQFTVKITDADGQIAVEAPIKANSGTGTRGTFDALVPFKVVKHGKGWLTVYEESAKDGKPTNVVKIRVHL